jgi:hypothetical protein
VGASYAQAKYCSPELDGILLKTSPFVIKANGVRLEFLQKPHPRVDKVSFWGELG